MERLTLGSYATRVLYISRISGVLQTFCSARAKELSHFWYEEMKVLLGNLLSLTSHLLLMVCIYVIV